MAGHWMRSATIRALERRDVEFSHLQERCHGALGFLVRVAVPFDPVFGQRPETPRKPDPEAALQIARHWGFAPERCRFIGDSTVDLETARAAGMPAIAIPHETVRDYDFSAATAILPSLAHVIPWIQAQ
jgi:phosphoglycolate phosphatase-like HAD superfamily hydrolase